MKFEKAMANVVMFQNEDVVTTSACCTYTIPNSNNKKKVWTCSKGNHTPITNKSDTCGNPNCTY